MADHWALFYKEKNADLNNRRRQDPEYNDDDDDADTLSDYKHFFGRDEDKYPSYFCDSDGEYRPELEAAHDRKEQIRTQFEAGRLENLKGNNGTVLTRSPCSLGPDWVRHKNRDDHTEGRGTTQNQKAEATSPHERAKKRHERAEATRVEKTKTATKAEASGDEKNARIDDGTTTTKKKKKNKKKAAASTPRPATRDPASLTDLPLGSRVPCLGRGEVCLPRCLHAKRLNAVACAWIGTEGFAARFRDWRTGKATDLRLQTKRNWRNCGRREGGTRTFYKRHGNSGTPLNPPHLRQKPRHLLPVLPLPLLLPPPPLQLPPMLLPRLPLAKRRKRKGSRGRNRS